MKTYYFFFLIFSALLSFLACDKDHNDPTVINLTVVDYFTEIPLEGVEYGLIATYRKPNSPLDATLRLIIKNQFTTKDSLYLVVQNDIISTDMPGNIKGHPFAFPIIINSSETTFFDIPSLANETLSIYWSWDKMDKYTPAPLRDQLIIPKGDTLDYLISN